MASQTSRLKVLSDHASKPRARWSKAVVVVVEGVFPDVPVPSSLAPRLGGAFGVGPGMLDRLGGRWGNIRGGGQFAQGVADTWEREGETGHARVSTLSITRALAWGFARQSRPALQRPPKEKPAPNGCNSIHSLPLHSALTSGRVRGRLTSASGP